MATNAYGYDDNSDLWGINPDTGRLYTTSERRWQMAQRGTPTSMLGGSLVPGDSWDNWFDKVAESNYAMTGKTPAELKTNFAGGASPAGSNQLRGQSLQSSTASLDNARKRLNDFGGQSQYELHGTPTPEMKKKKAMDEQMQNPAFVSALRQMLGMS